MEGQQGEMLERHSERDNHQEQKEMEDTTFITSDGYKDLQIKQKEKRKQEEKGGIGELWGWMRESIYSLSLLLG